MKSMQCLLLVWLQLVIDHGKIASTHSTVAVKYTVYGTNKTWNEARSVCESHGQQMLKLDTEDKYENFIAWKNIWMLTDVWTGLHLQAMNAHPSEVNFQWHDCDPIGNWAPWAVNEPNKLNVEKCVRFRVQNNLLRTRSCDMSLQVVCEELTDACTLEEFRNMTMGKLPLVPFSGDLDECKHACHNYSIGNQQCVALVHDNQIIENCKFVTGTRVYVHNEPPMEPSTSASVFVKRCIEGDYKSSAPSVSGNSDTDPITVCPSTSRSAMPLSSPLWMPISRSHVQTLMAFPGLSRSMIFSSKKSFERFPQFTSNLLEPSATYALTSSETPLNTEFPDNNNSNSVFVKSTSVGSTVTAGANPSVVYALTSSETPLNTEYPDNNSSNSVVVKSTSEGSTVTAGANPSVVYALTSSETPLNTEYPDNNSSNSVVLKSTSVGSTVTAGANPSVVYALTSSGTPFNTQYQDNNNSNSVVVKPTSVGSTFTAGANPSVVYALTSSETPFNTQYPDNNNSNSVVVKSTSVGSTFTAGANPSVVYALTSLETPIPLITDYPDSINSNPLVVESSSISPSSKAGVMYNVVPYTATVLTTHPTLSSFEGTVLTATPVSSHALEQSNTRVTCQYSNGVSSTASGGGKSISSKCECFWMTPYHLMSMVFNSVDNHLDRKNLSSYKRSKTSAKDDRVSAKAIGSSGIVIIMVVTALIMCMDVDRMIRTSGRPRKQLSIG